MKFKKLLSLEPKPYTEVVKSIRDYVNSEVRSIRRIIKSASADEHNTYFFTSKIEAIKNSALKKLEIKKEKNTSANEELIAELQNYVQKDLNPNESSHPKLNFYEKAIFTYSVLSVFCVLDVVSIFYSLESYSTDTLFLTLILALILGICNNFISFLIPKIEGALKKLCFGLVITLLLCVGFVRLNVISSTGSIMIGNEIIKIPPTLNEVITSAFFAYSPIVTCISSYILGKLQREDPHKELSARYVKSLKATARIKALTEIEKARYEEAKVTVDLILSDGIYNILCSIADKKTEPETLNSLYTIYQKYLPNKGEEL